MFRSVFIFLLLSLVLCLTFDTVVNQSDTNDTLATNETTNDTVITRTLVEFPCRNGYVKVRGECVEEY